MVATLCAEQAPSERESETPEQALHFISYVSTQARPLDTEELKELLQRAREYNTRANITGLLLHRDDSFFQILEGERDRIQALFETISKDRRHNRVEVVAQGPLREREFQNWQMAFIELDGQDFSALPGFSDIMNNTASAKAFLQTLSRSKKLALLFSVMQ